MTRQIFADIGSMSALIPVITAVLSNKLVIITAVVVFLYLNFVCFVAKYHKKQKPLPVKKTVAVAPAPEPAADTGGADDATADDDSVEE